MKLFLTTTLALSTICILETNQPAQATLHDSNFHLARGGHFGREGEIRREAERPAEEATRGDTGEGRRNDASSEPHTSEASRAEDRVHTLNGNQTTGEGAGKDASSEGATDGGRVHTLDRRDDGGIDGGECPNGEVGPDGACLSTGNSSGWTTVPN